MKHFTAVYFPEQWSITNGGVPVCHFVGESNNKEFAEFVAKALNAGQQSAQADFPPVARKKELCFVCGRVGCRKGH